MVWYLVKHKGNVTFIVKSQRSEPLPLPLQQRPTLTPTNFLLAARDWDTSQYSQRIDAPMHCDSGKPFPLQHMN